MGSLLLWGFVATLILTVSLLSAQSLGITRIDMSFILGTMVTPRRDRAKAIGYGMHVLIGLAAAFFYGAIFASLGMSSWWLGGAVGILQGLVVCLVVLPLLPAIHPRMVSDARGPQPTRLLEPPGRMGLNYGRRTPIVLLVAHALFGVVLGGFYAFT
ncbi:MAG: hypothetical protein M3041_11835 [Acidobacteriota bacterium]|nr:hypothetical protein [Acidobacteriota bacterium]